MNIAEIKAKTMLAGINEIILNRVLSRIEHEVRYKDKDAGANLITVCENIANQDKWEYMGILSKEDAAVRNALKEILNGKEE